jgi:NADPH2:quinone reductase
MRSLAPDGIDHIIEVAFGANIENEIELLKMGGSIATYATDSPTPKIPFWQMVFKNIRVFFLGSDDFSKDAKMLAAQDLTAPLKLAGLASSSANESRSQTSSALMNSHNARFDVGGL